MSIIETAIRRKDFLQVVKEAKVQSQAEKKEYNRVSKKEVVRNRLVQLYMTGVYNNRQIADILGVSTQTISRMLKEPNVIEAMKDIQEQEKDVIDSKLKSLRNRATDTLSELLDSDEESVRLQAVKMVLDKTGHGDKREIEQNINISYEQQLTQVLEGVSFDVQDLEYLPEGE